MGNCKSVCRDAVDAAWGVPIRDVTLVLLGLDNAGKTTLLANLNRESTEDATPTIGFASTSLELGRYELTVYDLGGGARIRNIWKSYYAEAHGTIYVVDASSMDRVAEAKEALSNVLNDERMVGKPLLIFANKQDKEGAIDESELVAKLELDRLLGENQELSSVVKCVALKSANRNRYDPAIRAGVLWLLRTVGRYYDEIFDRVRADMQVQRTEDARERRERAERVRRIREERERLAALQKAEGGGEVEEEDGKEETEMVNPFRPIEEVVREAEERERAAKARQKAAHPPPPSTSESQSSERVGTVAETTSNVSTGIRDTRSDGAACVLEETHMDNQGTHPVPPPPPRTESQSTLTPSDQDSGLSASSNSLTDVTPRSHAGSSESLPVSTADGPPPPPHQTIPPLHPPEAMAVAKPGRIRLDPLQNKTKDKGKKRSNTTLLSRLKNRNKTAPAPESPGSSSLQTKAPLPSVLQGQAATKNTWVTPEPAPPSGDSEGSRLLPEGPPSVPEGPRNGSSPLEDLPEMPRVRHMLPPIKVSTKPPGLGEKTFHVAEDITIPQSAILVSQTMPCVESVPA